MLRAAWPHVRGDLASTRRDAAVFLDNLEGICGATGRQDWVERWTTIGDAHSLVGDVNIENEAFNQATEAWLCALTAFEVARRLLDDDDPKSGDVSARVERGIHKFRSQQKVSPVQISCSDQAQIPAYYLSAGQRDVRAPAVICISTEEETGAMLLGRLLPVLVGKGVSVLAVSHDDVANRWRGQANTMLSCFLDYLLVQPEVDGSRIGVYGEGLSAVLATDFAVADHRIAAAVCDGGLWNWARTLASVAWITTTADAMDEQIASARRSQLVRQLRCPVLVVAGGRGTVSESEAIKLQAECAASRINMELTMPRMVWTPVGEIENFVTSDDSVFGWLAHKLAGSSRP